MAEAGIGVCGEHGEGAADAEVESTDPDHEHDLLAVFAERERGDKHDEEEQHDRHGLLISDLIVLHRIASSPRLAPASPRTDDTLRCTPTKSILPATRTYRP